MIHEFVNGEVIWSTIPWSSIVPGDAFFMKNQLKENNDKVFAWWVKDGITIYTNTFYVIVSLNKRSVAMLRGREAIVERFHI